MLGGGFARLGLGQRVGGLHAKTSQDIERSSCSLFNAFLHSILVHDFMVKLCLPQAMMDEMTSSSSSSLENYEARKGRRTTLSTSEEPNKFQNIDVFHVSPCRNTGGNARIQSYTVIHTRDFGARAHSGSHMFWALASSN